MSFIIQAFFPALAFIALVLYLFALFLVWIDPWVEAHFILFVLLDVLTIVIATSALRWLVRLSSAPG